MSAEEQNTPETPRARESGGNAPSEGPGGASWRPGEPGGRHAAEPRQKPQETPRRQRPAAPEKKPVGVASGGRGEVPTAARAVSTSVDGAKKTAEAAGKAAEVTKGTADAAAGGASGGASKVAKVAVNAGSKVAEGDAMGAVDDGVQAAAVAGASAVASPVAGAAVDAILRTKAGKKVTRLASRLIVGVVGAVLGLFALLGLLTFQAVSGAMQTLLGGAATTTSGQSAALVGPDLSWVQSQNATEILNVAISHGLSLYDTRLLMMIAWNNTRLVNMTADDGDGQHVGVFKMGPTWGPEGDRTNVDAATSLLIDALTAPTLTLSDGTKPNSTPDGRAKSAPWLLAQAVIGTPGFAGGEDYKASFVDAALVTTSLLPSLNAEMAAKDTPTWDLSTTDYAEAVQAKVITLSTSGALGTPTTPGSYSETVPNPPGQSNGKIDPSLLVEIPWAPGEYLWGPALKDLTALNDAYRARFGTNLGIVDAYRDYSGQQAAYHQYGPSRAAKPGTSNHGWARAIDVAIKGYNTEQYKWLIANGPIHGWDNPSYFREGNNSSLADEYWHFEWRTGD